MTSDERTDAQLRRILLTLDGCGRVAKAEVLDELLRREVARKDEALRPLAAVKAREETMVALHGFIIEQTGNGEWADAIYELLTKDAEVARRALTGEDE